MASLGTKETPKAIIFHSQHRCEKAMKACLALMGIFVAERHEVSNLFVKQIFPEMGEIEKRNFQNLLSEIEKIEWFYVPSRYGVDRYGKVWVREFDIKEVKKIFRIAQSWLNMSFEFIENKLDFKLPHSKEALINYLKRDYSDVIKE